GASEVVGFRRAPATARGWGSGPPPVEDARLVFTMLGDVLPVCHERVSNRLLGVRRSRTKCRHTIDDIADETKTIQLGQDAHIERRRGGAFLLVAPDMQVAMVGPPVRQAMDEPRVAMKRENH